MITLSPRARDRIVSEFGSKGNRLDRLFSQYREYLLANLTRRRLLQDSLQALTNRVEAPDNPV